MSSTRQWKCAAHQQYKIDFSGKRCHSGVAVHPQSMRTDRCCNFLRENAGDDVASVQLPPNVLVTRGKITAFYGFPQSLYLGIFTLLPSKTRLMIDIFVGLFCLETTIGVGLVWLPIGERFAFRPTCWGVPLLFGFGRSFFLSRAHAYTQGYCFFCCHICHTTESMKQKSSNKAVKLLQNALHLLSP